MKNKIGIFALVTLLILGVASVGMAASDGSLTVDGFKNACWNILDTLSPEEQEQFEDARAKFTAEREELRQAFFEELPDEVRAAMEERMKAKAEHRGGRMNRYCGNHFDE